MDDNEVKRINELLNELEEIPSYGESIWFHIKTTNIMVNNYCTNRLKHQFYLYLRLLEYLTQCYTGFIMIPAFYNR